MTDYKGPNAFSSGLFKPAKAPKIVEPYQRAPSAALSSDNFFTGDMADYYFTAPAAFFDLTNPTNIAKFIAAGKPVSLGANGSTPTGVQPYVFFSRTGSNPAEFATNKGSGGPFTFTGTALTNATTSPSS